MTSVDPILVTGAAGNVGREVVRALLERGTSVIAADHRTDRIKVLFGERVLPARLDFCERASWDLPLQNARHMFLVRPPAIADVQNNLIPFIDHMRSRGIDHVVFLSVAGAGKNRLVPHRKVEEHLRRRGDHHTNLRPGFFAQNLQSAYLHDILEDHRIYVPAGLSVVNWIDVRDVAEVAALILCNPEPHRGANYTLAGPGPVAWAAVAEALGDALGTTIHYQPASVLGYARHMRKQGLPSGAIVVQTILHVLLRFGQGALVDPTLERLLGRAGRSVFQYIADHANHWKP